MTTTADELREEVRRRYAEAAIAAGSGGCGCEDDGGCCGNVSCAGEGDGRVRPCALHRRGTRGAPGRGGARQPRVRQPDRRRGAGRGRDRARSRLGWRHRRDPLGPARGPRRSRVRPGHDGRDAVTGEAERSRGRRAQRPLPEGPHRGDPAARRERRRDHLELRDQPLRRQARRAARDGAGARAGRADRDHRRRRRGPALEPKTGPSAAASSAASPERSHEASTSTASKPRGSWTSACRSRTPSPTACTARSCVRRSTRRRSRSGRVKPLPRRLRRPTPRAAGAASPSVGRRRPSQRSRPRARRRSHRRPRGA